ncbi:unnamed protein product [Camellia sinensis]
MATAVIDSYAVLLMEEQETMAARVEFLDKSYIVSSICLDMLQSDNTNARDRFVLDNLAARKDCCYIHFPICFRSHWMLVVYDTEMGRWKNYNSMRPRTGIEGKHFIEAIGTLLLKSRKTQFSGLVEDVMTQVANTTLELVMDCPQQKPDSTAQY